MIRLSHYFFSGSTADFKRHFGRLCSAVAFLAVFFLSSTHISAQSFRFAVAADERNFTLGAYASSFYFRGACEAIQALPGGAGEFIFVAGDMDPAIDTRSVIDTYIGSSLVWYPVVGNHDLPGGGIESSSGANMIYLRAANAGGSTLPNIVNSGPDGCVETTYSFDFGNAHFVVLNIYYDGASDTGSDGNIVDALYNWLSADLAATTKTHIFVIGHEPAYPQADAANGRLRHVGDSLDQYPANRNRFWSLLSSRGVVAYICGHTHNYSTFFYNNVYQIDAGHARGLGDTGAKSTFLMFTVNGDNVSFEVYRDNYDGGPYTLTATETLRPLATTESLIPAGSDWKYLDNGTDQGTAWKEPAFDDSGWSQGPAQLGYGDGDEATTLGFGLDGNNKFITTYFRHHFYVANAASFHSMTMQILRDDGAVVYLNGTEAYRTNMPAESVFYTTLASSALGDPAENSFYAASVNPALLVNGDNVMAAEVHQFSGSSSDLGFDFSLYGHGPAIAVNLTDFSARLFNDQILLEWTALSEIDHAGYNLYRRSSGDDRRQKINDALICRADDSSLEGQYQFFDHPEQPGVYEYQLEDISLSGFSTFHGLVAIGFSSSQGNDAAPLAWQLHQNFPNPFNQETMLRYSMPVDGAAMLAVYDVRGILVKRLITGLQSSGVHVAKWDGRDEQGRMAAGGLYWLSFKTGAYSDVVKMLLIR